MTPVEYMVVLFGLAFGFGATWWLTYQFNLRRPNFRGERIPSVAGLAFVLAGEFIYGYEWLSKQFHPAALDPAPDAVYFLVTLGFGALGLCDDLLGDRSVGGFRGHFHALFQGRLTTGAAKALGGAVVSLVAGFLLYHPHVIPMLLAALLIALSANTLNLLDLRPGRCLFGFFLGALAIIATLLLHHIAAYGFLFYIAVVFAVILYPLDAGGRVMLGDTGSNVFGAVLGLATALFFSTFWQCVVIVLMLLFQLWSEKHSVSRAIENTPLLRSLDRKIGVR